MAITYACGLPLVAGRRLQKGALLRCALGTPLYAGMRRLPVQSWITQEQGLLFVENVSLLLAHLFFFGFDSGAPLLGGLGGGGSEWPS